MRSLAFAISWLAASCLAGAAAASSPPDSTSSHAHAASPMGHDMSAMGHDMGSMEGMDMSETHAHGAAMRGMLGRYAMTREASGTAWQPDAATHEGWHAMRRDWTLMAHGAADVVFDHQGGPRGEDRVFSDNMAMLRAWRTFSAGTVGARAMLSAEPATIGKRGYPLLLQTGETADGVHPLIDRQHPHDLLMELAASAAVDVGEHGSAFVYAGLPGEPALGPPAFMHRFSGERDPVAPITHHWLDSTHLTFGVLTAGAVWDALKFEASAFRGREPDQDRWNVETPKLDSHAFRLSWNPTEHWALQGSLGRLHSPEQLEPDVDQNRVTASAIYDGRFSAGHWEGTLAWGRDRNRPGHTLDAFLAEATAEFASRHTLFLRAERTQKDELFEAPDPRTGRVFDVGSLTAGYRIDLSQAGRVTSGLGVAGTLALVPAALHDAYGDTPASLLVFAHARLR